MVLLPALLILSAHSAPLAAPPQLEVEARYSPTFGECIDASMATADRIFCLQAEIGRQEATLKSAYARAAKRLPPRSRRALNASQASWKGKAETECLSQTSGEEFETVAAADRDQCLLDATIRRTMELERRR